MKQGLNALRVLKYMLRMAMKQGLDALRGLKYKLRNDGYSNLKSIIYLLEQNASRI